jgi:DNA-binding MarR family transcriptional regulator
MSAEETNKTNAELKDELLHALFMLRNLHFQQLGGRKPGGGIRRDMMANEFGLSIPAFALLKQVQLREEKCETGGAWLSDMRDYLCISKAAVSQMLGTLEGRGFITREIDPNNRRTIIVKLTEEGCETIKRFELKFDSYTGIVIDRVGKKDTQEMIRLIYKLADIIRDIQNEPDAETGK